MRHRDLTRTQRQGAATDQRDSRRAVVRRAKRWTAHEPPVGQGQTGRGVDARNLDRLPVVEERQQAGEPAGEHRLARARRAHHQEVVAAGCRDLERLSGKGLAAHFAQVGQRDRVGCRCGGGLHRPGTEVAERGDHFAQGAGAKNLAAPHDAGLVEARHGDDDGRALECPDERERPRNRSDRAVEAELADECVIVEPCRRQLVGGRQDADGDCEIETRTGFGQTGRREVDGETTLRPLLVARQQRRPHSVARFAARGTGKPDDGVRGQPAGRVNFDGDAVAFDAEQRRR